MYIDVRPLTTSNARDLSPRAAQCLFWELGESCGDRSRRGDPRFDKEGWINHILLTWGTCGFIAYVSPRPGDIVAMPAASVIFGPPPMLPGAEQLPTAPVSPDAVLLTTVHVRSAYAGLFLENRLIESALDELSRRGCRAVEAFAEREQNEEISWNLSRDLCDDTDAEGFPVLDEAVYQELDFDLVADDTRYPRYRYELVDTQNLFAAVEETLRHATVTMGLRMKKASSVDPRVSPRSELSHNDESL